MIQNIPAGYYAANNELIYSVEVNCGDQTWKSYAPNLEDPQTPELYQEGKLEKACVDGEDWDLIFKVKQAHQFTWMFNAESLQYGKSYLLTYLLLTYLLTYFLTYLLT